MVVKSFDIADVRLIELKRFGDARGFFIERYNANSFAAAGFSAGFVQDNHSRSEPGTLRGLHYQHSPAQAKLVTCLRGQIWDVAVDLRLDSPSFGRHVAIELRESEPSWLWIPAGFAHGFCVLGDEAAEVFYKVDQFYEPKGEGAISWNDPELAISWPIAKPILSERDRQAKSLQDYRGSVAADSPWWR